MISLTILRTKRKPRVQIHIIRSGFRGHLPLRCWESLRASNMITRTCLRAQPCIPYASCIYPFHWWASWACILLRYWSLSHGDVPSKVTDFMKMCSDLYPYNGRPLRDKSIDMLHQSHDINTTDYTTPYGGHKVVVRVYIIYLMSCVHKIAYCYSDVTACSRGQRAIQTPTKAAIRQTTHC